ncbi:hypothetical protein DL771_004922 [Monosporascus sp. 5C6A]|nr:hypothetical protein DL771_004922 [Monosporascus sp. 5C6A]
MPVLQCLTNATSSAAHTATQPTLLQERLTNTIRGLPKLQRAGLTALAAFMTGLVLGTLVVLCVFGVTYIMCRRRDPAHCPSKPKRHNSSAGIVMNDWNNKTDSSDSVGPQYVGARSAWGPIHSYGVAGGQPRRE